MKKFFKALALVLALALVVGVVPAQSASAKIKAKKVLYTAAPKGWSTTDDTLKSSLKTKVRIYTLAGDKKAVAADHEYKAVIKSGDEFVDVTEKYVVGKELGKAVVEIFKDGESLGTSVITVRKNADASTLKLQVKDGDAFVDVTADTTFVAGVTYRLALPRAKADSDERRLTVDDKAIEDVEGSARQYDVTFDEGEHTIAFEAFQGGVLDGYTAQDSIKITAKTPAAKSAKQVSANSFEVTFDSAMKVNGKNLITKDNVANQDIYYLIAKQPVVTGVIKSVTVSEEDPKVVKVEMYAAFNSDTDYYFTFGDAEPVKFHTAKNDIKYAKTLKLVEAAAYYVGQDTPIEYKFLDENGVELAISDLPAFEITSDYAYGIGTNIYFHAEGTATIKASIVTGYDEETNKAITLTDTLTVTGVKKTTTQTGKVYSFSNNVDDAKHTIRIGDPNSKLLVKYTLSDGNKTTIDSTTGSYYLKSTDETVAMIGTGTNVVYGVNAGSATIVLYDGDNTVLDAFPITVLDANKVGSATAELSKTTLNRDGGVTDDITLTVVGYDLDGSKDSTYAQNYTVTVQQLENNDVATKVTINGRNAYTIAHAGSSTATLNLNDNTLAIVDSRTDKTQFATIRLVVTVKNASGTKVLEKTLSFVVSEQDTPNAYKLTATKNALDTSIKNWGYTDLSTKTSVIGVNAVKTTSYGDFFIANETFDVISSVNNIPATDTAGTVGNFVIRSFPTTNGVDPVAAALDNGTVDTLAQATNNVTVTAFPSTTTRCQTGSYTFTGYHVEYGNDTKGVRTSLGTQTVMVSRSDVAATAAIKDGKASTFNANYSADANIENIFKVTWEGLNSDDNNGRVNITSCNSPTYDTQSEAWYCRKITVSFVLDTDANGDPGTYTFTQNININKLFKND